MKIRTERAGEIQLMIRESWHIEEGKNRHAPESAQQGKPHLYASDLILQSMIHVKPLLHLFASFCRKNFIFKIESTKMTKIEGSLNLMLQIEQILLLLYL